MKFIYVGCFCEPSQMDFIKKHTNGRISISATTFQKALLQGFKNLTNRFDYIVNLPDVGSFPMRCSTLYFPKSFFEFASMSGVNASFLNITYIKRNSICRSLYKELANYLTNYWGEKIVIVVYSLMYPYLKAVINIKKKFPNIHVCCIVLDLPEYFNDSKLYLNKMVDNNATKKIYSLVPEIDSFILLTEFMKNKLSIGNRPWILLEGIYNPIEISRQEKRKKTILYTGKLDLRFGIKEMINAFMKIKDKEFVLWICGSGQDQHYVEESVKKDSRIKYWGVVDQTKVFEMQRQATILINPRKGDADYTKYSFPSKTMEYMASGTPTLMYPLPGIPTSYLKHLIIIPDNSLETLITYMTEWTNKDQKILDKIGNEAREFILNNKNSEVQAVNLYSFISSL